MFRRKPIDSLDALLPEDAELGASAAHEALSALACTVEPIAPGISLRQRLVSSVQRSREGRLGIFADRIARLFDVPLESALELLAKVESGTAWKAGIAEGIEMFSVRTGPKYPGAMAGFGRLRPGARFPKHGHLGDETTLVMAGGFRDSSGIEVERGDELYEAPGSEHDFVVLDGEDCIAAVIALNGIELK